MHYAGAVYHVMLRGHARQKIFADDEDQEGLCELLAEGVGRCKAVLEDSDSYLLELVRHIMLRSTNRRCVVKVT